jgi:alkylation response protein AidB-like acyl-CoA dehydrogenase
MIRLELSSKIATFRDELRDWLKSNQPDKVKRGSSLEAFIEIGKKWQKKLSEGRFIGVHWPVEYGGRGLSLVEEAVVQEELVAASAPQILGLFGLTMVGPVLIQHGTPEQKTKYLKKILSGDEIWCQGFSEPNAGSDLANIKTVAEKVDGGFLVTGQKVWTSFAQVADHCFLLARTSSSGKKHEGLTYLLLPMKAKGIEIRPLKQISGEDEFNEVFFDKVFVPDENVVGGVGNGWKIAISTLMYERVVLTFARHIQSEVALRELLKEKRNSKAKEKLALAVATTNAVRALAYSHLLEYVGGKTPGPEGSMDKLFWSESFQEIAKLALELEGGALSEEESPNMLRYLYSRGRTIAAGTSEIQRGIIAERVLGLPRG